MGEESLFGFISMFLDGEDEFSGDDGHYDEEEEEYEEEDEEEEDPDACDEGLESPHEQGRKRWQGLRNYTERAFRRGAQINID